MAKVAVTIVTAKNTEDYCIFGYSQSFPGRKHNLDPKMVTFEPKCGKDKVGFF